MKTWYVDQKKQESWASYWFILNEETLPKYLCYVASKEDNFQGEMG